MPHRPKAKEMRKHKRYKIDSREIRVRLAFANEVKIHDISLGGISLKTDRRIDIGKEYHLKLSFRKSEIALKGIAVWSLLGNSQSDSKGNVTPIYSCGLRFATSGKEKIDSFIELLEEDNKKADKQIDIQASEFIDLSQELKEVMEVVNWRKT